MTDRPMGIESEYGFVWEPADRSTLSVDGALKSLVAQVGKRNPSVEDGCRGVFLGNGSLCLVECGHHAEVATPEVTNPWDAVRYVLAGDRLLLDAAAAIEASGEGRPILLRSNVHYLSEVSWGTHESIGTTASTAVLQAELVPFLVSRLYLGAGGFDVLSPGIRFVLSPRAVFLTEVVSGHTTGHRGLFNTKNESLCRGTLRRLHLICGESLHSETAAWLRTASLVLAVRLAEAGVQLGETSALEDTLLALRQVNGDTSLGIPLALADGSSRTAVSIQRAYLAAAEAHATESFMPLWAPRACEVWRAMLDRVESGDGSLFRTIDWAIKYSVYGRHLARRGYDWESVASWTDVVRDVRGTLADRIEESNPDALIALFDNGVGDSEFTAEATEVIESIGRSRRDLEDFLRLRSELFAMDLRFGQLGDGLFAELDRAGVLDHHMPGVDNIEHAMAEPPACGRARLRGRVIQRVQANREAFAASWEYVHDRSSGMSLDLTNPFETDEKWLAGVQKAPAPEQGAGRAAGPYTSRASALEHVLRGELDAAEEILRHLLAPGCEQASTLTHLARVAVLKSQYDVARRWIDDAGGLAGAPAYVRARVQWFRILFAMLDGVDTSPWLVELRRLLSRDDCRMDWTMAPVLAHIESRLERPQFELLRGCVEVMSGSSPLSALDAFADWPAETDTCRQG